MGYGAGDDRLNGHRVAVVEHEAVELHYERKLFPVGPQLHADPRVSHALTLDVDAYGNVLRSVAVGYGRRFVDPEPLLTSADHSNQRQTLMKVVRAVELQRNDNLSSAIDETKLTVLFDGEEGL